MNPVKPSSQQAVYVRVCGRCKTVTTWGCRTWGATIQQRLSCHVTCIWVFRQMCVRWTHGALTPAHVVPATRPGRRLQSALLRAGMSLAPPRGWAGQTRASSAASPCECRRSPGCRCPHALSMSLCKDSLMTLVTRPFGSNLLASGVLISWY